MALVGTFFQDSFGSVRHGSHRGALPERPHLTAPLMALSGMSFQDGLTWQRLLRRSSACPLGRPHLAAPLMTLIGMFFRGGLTRRIARSGALTAA